MADNQAHIPKLDCTRDCSVAFLRLSATLAGILAVLVASPAVAQDFKDFDDLMEGIGPRIELLDSSPEPSPQADFPTSERFRPLNESDASSGSTDLNRDLESPFESLRRRSPLELPDWNDDRSNRIDDRRSPADGFNEFDRRSTDPSRSAPFDPSFLPRETPADQPRPDVIPIGNGDLADADPSFDWRQQSTSVADLRFESMDDFRHGEAFLSTAEEKAYMDLLETIRERRRELVKRTTSSALTRSVSTGQVMLDAETRVSGKGVAEWQESFYEFPEARRLAWNNGHLRGTLDEKLGGLPDPFAPVKKEVAVADESDGPYRLLDDIRRYPEHFVGRPIVLHGRFVAESVVRLGGPDPNATTYQASPLGAEATTPETVTMMRGRLLGLNSSDNLAMVDTKELLTPQMGPLEATEWPGEEEAIPVLVKGWVVKRWDNRPLIYCESMRQISPIPHFQLVRASSVDRSRLRDGEKWLYYETLRQMELTSDDAQHVVAMSILNQRIDELMLEVEDKAKSDLQRLRDDFKADKIDEAKFDRGKVILQRKLDQRVGRYRKYRQHPEEFQTFVDVFQHSDFWHGHLVSLRGHVRHVVSYPGDQKLFNGRTLHELWLFTDDSQHNPAVIITPNLPADFPTEAEVVDGVTVTGCLFKRYIYGSQDADRIAPLLLAGRVHWTPTVDQVRTLVAEGHLAKDSARAVKAASLGRGLGETALMFACFLVIFTFMVLWGRMQREERERVRLRRRINDVADGLSPVLPGYGTLGDYIPDEYRVDQSENVSLNKSR